MSQKLRLPNIGSKTIINGLLKPILSPKSQILRDKMSLARYFAYIASSGFTGGLVFKFACPTIDYQPQTSQNSRFSVFIGHQ